MNKKIFPLIIIAIWLSAITICFAAEYKMLEAIPTPGGGIKKDSSVNLSGYLETVFAFGISLAGILAVAVIVVGGIQYITAYGNTGMVTNAKNRITQALLGLLLAIGAWLILYTINPDLAKGKLTIPPINNYYGNKEYYQ